MKHVIMGTAGHVDHGKTTVIKALTGFDCDTHQQEKQRGITINLGFTHFDLDSENSIGIVDVPGHSDFINTMISGAAGIDFVLLVVSADEGIKPQTYEHLEIMKLLNIKKGLIVLTKIDLVDDELVDLAKEEIKDFVKNSFLEDTPIIAFSAIKNQGIDELKKNIKIVAKEVISKAQNGMFRMYIDRIFTIQGFGTVINGSVLCGTLHKDDQLYLFPKDKEIRLRSLQRHGKNVDVLVAGDRGSMNIVGLKKSDFQRGMLITNEPIKPTELVDVNVSLFESVTPLKRWNNVIFLLNTNRMLVRLHLLEKEILLEKETGVAQIYLPQPVVTIMGDRFIIRDSSDSETLGGGEIIDPYPLHHRRPKPDQLDVIKKLTTGNINNIIEANVKKMMKPISVRDLKKKLNFHQEIDQEKLTLSREIKAIVTSSDVYLVKTELIDKMKEKILTSLHQFHTQFPIFETGRNLHELKGLMNNKSSTYIQILPVVLEEMQTDEQIKKINNTWCVYSHHAKFSKSLNILMEKLEKWLLDSNLNNQVNDFSSMKIQFSESTENDLKMLLSFLELKGKIRKIDHYFFHTEFLKKVEQILINYLEQHTKEGISLAQYRDLIHGNRRNAMILLDFFEHEKIVYNLNNVRFLTTNT